MKIKLLTLCLLLLLPTLPVLTVADGVQESEKEKAQKALERRQELERKTFLMVDETATEALGLRLPENRSFSLAAAADLLWKHDEKRARNLFWDALNTLNLMTTPPPIERAGKVSPKEKVKSQKSYFAIFALRQEVLRKVAQRDPQFALELLNATRQPPMEQANTGFRFPDDRDLEQQIAAEAVARDPKRALQVAREALAKGFSFQLLDLLYRLNAKDPELGTRFAGELIDKLQTHDSSSDIYSSHIAIQLVVSSRTPKEATGDEPRWASFRRLELEKEQRRRLVETIVNTALGGATNGNPLWDIDRIRPELEEFFPERLPLLERKMAAFTRTLNKEQKISVEYHSLYEKGTPEEMLALALRSGGDGEWIQQQAIIRAVMNRRVDSFREFINSKVDDLDRRKSVLDALDTEQIGAAAHRGDAEELRKLLPGVRLKEERAHAMAELAILLERKGNHDEAAKLLDEAQALVKQDFRSPTQTNALLALAVAYAIVDPPKAFMIIERAIDSANDEISKALLLDKILRSGVFKQGEIMLRDSGVIPLDFALFKYGKGVAALATADFNRTRAAADRLQRSELRIMARLLMAQALLGQDKRILPNEK